MPPSQHDWKIVYRDFKLQSTNQPTKATATNENITKNLDNYQGYCESYKDNGPYVEYETFNEE